MVDENIVHFVTKGSKFVMQSTFQFIFRELKFCFLSRMLQSLSLPPLKHRENSSAKSTVLDSQ